MTKNPAKTRSIPEQQDCNVLAAFIEAAEELQREPFFSLAGPSAAPKTGANRGTPFVDRLQFRSALIIFRQIWNEREPSNFAAAGKLLKRFEEAGPSLDEIRNQHKEITERQWENLQAKAGELVELWLNAMFPQISSKGPKGEPWGDRIEFEKLIKAHGRPHLENLCRSTVSALGNCYFGLLKVACPALARWEQDYGLRPDFEIGALFAPLEEATPQPAAAPFPKPSTHPLATAAPQRTTGNAPEESGPKLQKFEQALARDEFKPLKAILDSLSRDRLAICEGISSTVSYPDLLARLGYKIVLEPQIHYQDCYARVGPAGGIRTVLPYHDVGTHSTLVTLVNLDSTITTTPKTAGFFNKRFTELKAILAGN